MSVDSLRSECQGEVTVPRNGKKGYQPPILVCYGSVSALTQAALTGNAEGSLMSNPNMSVQSDMRLKQNITRVGTHPLGFGLYLFDYKPEFRKQEVNVRQFGVMAQEVEVLMSDAVMTYSDGYKRVNYEMLGINLSARHAH